MNNRARFLVAFVAALLLSGCTSAPQTRQLTASPPASIHSYRLISGVPFYAQEQYQCGPAALAMLLNHADVAVTPQELIDKVYVPERQGAFQVEMVAANRSYRRLALPIEPSLSSLLNWVDRGQPVLVLQNLGLSWYPKWHYAVVVGYDLKKKKIILNSGLTQYYTISMALFERTWARSHYWGMVALQPGSLPLAENETTYFLAVADATTFIAAAEAQNAWLAGLQQWPTSKNLLMAYGNYLYGQNQFGAAADIFKKVVALYPDYAPGYNNLAATHISTGEFAKAIPLATKAIALDPANRATYSQTLHEARQKRQNF
ncbi:MAG: PA2778 family cysteine peptidase [Porticoccaceae bacterium]|nr:PA2778 family cysteine peptidase [Porticoccaceae bacterium]